MRGLRWLAVAALLLLAVLPAHAVEPAEVLPNPVLEHRAREIGRQLRCVVCQNQSIDDSNAEVARDMRRAVRERLTAGLSDAEIFDYMTARYGDYVLLNPPFKPATFLLWLGAPLVLLIAGSVLLTAALRRRRQPVAPPPLTADERARLAAILKGTVIPAVTAPTAVTPSPSASLRAGSAKDLTPAKSKPHPEEAAKPPSRRAGN